MSRAARKAPRKPIRSYSQLYCACPNVMAPRDVEELEQCLRKARDDQRHVTIRAGGHSFDAQSLGDEIVISLEKLASIRVHDDQDETYGWVTVGPGATWGAISDELQQRGLVAPVMVTASKATAGGTLSGDCLSRFSPSYGKEGNWVERFRLLPIGGGDELTCTPQAPALLDTGWDDWDVGTRAFYGAVGGLGYLGAVSEITYRVLRVQEGGGPIAVSSALCRHSSFDALAEALVPAAIRMLATEGDPRDPRTDDAISATLIPQSGNGQESLMFTSRIRPMNTCPLKPIHDVAPWVWWCARSALLTRLIWFVADRRLPLKGEYLDDLRAFTFFMDGHAKAKQSARRWRLTFKTIQQTFVVPLDPTAVGHEEISSLVAVKRLTQWLSRAAEVFAENELTPTLQDVLFVRDEAPFLLSANARLPGFAVSYAFETNDAAKLASIRRAFGELSGVLHDSEFGGRVYLVKNVHATQGTLRAMYGSNAERFFALKRELDPGGLLCNDFLMRTFGELYRRTYPDATAPQTSAAC